MLSATTATYRPSCGTKPSERGFTLLEIMIVVALLGVVAAFAVSYSGTFFAKSRLNQLARGCYSATSVARAEAVRSSRHTVVAFEAARCVAYYDNQTSGTKWTYDAGIDTLLYAFNYSDANLTAADITVDTTQLTQGVSGTGTITPSFIFNGSGYSVKLTTANTLEQPSVVSVIFKNNHIPSTSNVLRRIEATVAGAVRVYNN